MANSLESILFLVFCVTMGYTYVCLYNCQLRIVKYVKVNFDKRSSVRFVAN